ncbi:hypothetical protein KJN74_05370 [Candidatus Bathyarchaeota archaeon]|nr:hypothetical protein [Candidatus Bathyarchaeota archaeon]
MKSKLCLIVLGVLLCTISFTGISLGDTEETTSVYYLEYGGLKIDVTAPVQSYPGQTILVSVQAQAITEIFVKYLRIGIFGALNATHKITLREITHLENSAFASSYESTYNITIPNNMVPGLTYGILSSEWELMGSPQKIPESGFVLTYIRNLDLEHLQAEFETLNTTHQSLLQNYSELESTFKEDVESTRNLNYVFIATTVIAGITVIVLLMRKPKKIWI